MFDNQHEADIYPDQYEFTKTTLKHVIPILLMKHPYKQFLLKEVKSRPVVLHKQYNSMKPESIFFIQNRETRHEYIPTKKTHNHKNKDSELYSGFAYIKLGLTYYHTQKCKK